MDHITVFGLLFIISNCLFSKYVLYSVRPCSTWVVINLIFLYMKDEYLIIVLRGEIPTFNRKLAIQGTTIHPIPLPPAPLDQQCGGMMTSVSVFHVTRRRRPSEPRLSQLWRAGLPPLLCGGPPAQGPLHHRCGGSGGGGGAGHRHRPARAAYVLARITAVCMRVRMCLFVRVRMCLCVCTSCGSVTVLRDSAIRWWDTGMLVS